MPTPSPCRQPGSARGAPLCPTRGSPTAPSSWGRTEPRSPMGGRGARAQVRLSGRRGPLLGGGGQEEAGGAGLGELGGGGGGACHPRTVWAEKAVSRAGPPGFPGETEGSALSLRLLFVLLNNLKAHLILIFKASLGSEFDFHPGLTIAPSRVPAASLLEPGLLRGPWGPARDTAFDPEATAPPGRPHPARPPRSPSRHLPRPVHLLHHIHWVFRLPSPRRFLNFHSLLGTPARGALPRGVPSTQRSAGGAPGRTSARPPLPGPHVCQGTVAGGDWGERASRGNERRFS